MERNKPKPLEKKTKMLRILQRSKHVGRYTETQRFTWGEIKQILKEKKLELQDDDILTVGFQEGFYEEDNSRDPSYDLTIERPRLETDEEFEARKKRIEESKVSRKTERYQAFLKLKAEFEPEKK